MRRVERPPVTSDSPAEAPAFIVSPPGEKKGMALFPPPGTKPIKVGIVVPEDFELTEGYVRHFQATEVEWIGEAREPIALPEDRVVPVEPARGVPPHLAALCPAAYLCPSSERGPARVIGARSSSSSVGARSGACCIGGVSNEGAASCARATPPASAKAATTTRARLLFELRAPITRAGPRSEEGQR